MKISRGPSELTVFFYLGLFSHECQCAHQLICPKIYQINSIVIIFFLFFSNLITQTEILRLSIQILQTQIVLLQKWPHSHIVIAWCLHYHGHMTWDMFLKNPKTDQVQQQHCLYIIIVTHAVDLYRQQIRKLKHKV